MCIITLSAFIKHVLSLHCDVQIEKIKTAILNSLFHRLNCCYMTPLLCATVASVLRSQNSCITVLDLGHNNLGDGGVKRLCDGLWNANCKVKTLNLSHNNVGEQGVKELCKVLIRPTSKLLTLDLSCNDLGDLGLESLAFALHERCTLQGLRYVQQYVHIKGLP